LLSGRELPRASPLVSTGILDSTAVLKLLIFLEEFFHITISDQELIPATFENVDLITAFVERKRALSVARET
jgi:acyl carrier protein